MEKTKISKKLIALILTFMILFSVCWTTISLAIEIPLESEYYEIDETNKIISRVEPETTVEIFKQKYNIESVQPEQLTIYKDNTKNEEVTTGFVGTGMIVSYEDIDGIIKDYEISVVGDFDKDGKATQVELTNIIRHIVGLTGAELKGIYYESADLTGDGLVDQRDITKYIRYIVFGELDLGKVDTNPPYIKLETLERKVSKLKVQATAIDREVGMGEDPIFTFYIKKKSEPDSAYVEVQSSTSSICEITGLEEETWYNVKVTVADKVGNLGSTSMLVITDTMPDGLQPGEIEFSEPIWNDGKATINITTNTGYFIEYQVNGTEDGKWIRGNQAQNLNCDDIVYARLTDGVNVSKNYKEQKVFDEIDPTVTLNIVKGISELNVTANAVDNESGIATDAEYVFYIKEADGTYVEKQRSTSNTCAITGLKSNTDYTVKVEVEDRAGNVGFKEQTVTTEGLPNINNAGALEFSSVIWESGLAKVTISTNTLFKIEYQVNGTTDGNWTTATTGTTSVLVQNLNHNDIVYARLTDGINVSDTKNIKIEDKIAPNVTLSLNKTTSSITATASATDKETGIATDEEYVFYLNAIEKDRNTSGTYIFTGLAADADYTIKVEIKDKAGNVGSKEQGTSTENVPSASTPGNIMFSAATWTSGTASVTISTTTSYTIEYQVNGVTEGAWTAGTTVSGLKHNDVIYARLTDGTNAGSYISQTIVDAIAPNVSLTLTTATQKITATATATDNESGIPTDVTYKFSIKDTGADDSTYVEKQNTTSNTCEFTGLVEGKDYTIKVEVVDNAGNVGIKEESKEIPDDIAPVVNLTVTGKTSNSITAQASATDVGGMPSSPTYVFYIKKTGEADTSYRQVQSSSSTTCTFTGLATNTDYTIKVTVKDDAGNEGMKEVSSLTDRIPNGTDAGAITFSSITWTSGKATVTIKTNTSYTIEYQVNGIADGSWVEGTTVNNLLHGDVIYARLTDGVSSSSPATLNVVDDKKPQVTLSLTGAISEITATAAANDNESGITTTATYKFSIKKASEPDTSYVVKQNTTSNVCNITGLVQGTNYVVKVEVQDAAGNTNYATQSIKTNTMPSATTAGAITFGTPVWQTGTAKVEISTTTSYYIEYQVNRTTGTWTRATVAGTSITATSLNHNDIVYARLTDGVNAGDYASITIADTVKPENFTIDVTDITYEGFTIKGSTQDLETGIKNYTYVVEDKTGTKVVEEKGQTVTQYLVEGLTEETEYVVYMIAYDNAGNVTKSNEVTIITEKAPLSKAYGQKVNYISNNGYSDWQVFYIKEIADESTNEVKTETFLVSTDYVPNSLINSYSNMYKDNDLGYWMFYAHSSIKYREITQDVRDVFMMSWNKSTSRRNVKYVSNMLETPYWDGFANSNIEGSMAIGGPTIEMWIESWNDSYPTDVLSYSNTGVYGYNIGEGETATTVNVSLEGKKGEYNSLYVPHLKRWNGCYAWALSSPLNTKTDYPIVSVNHSSSSDIELGGFTSGGTTGAGYRPCVYIPSIYELQWNATTNMYDIVEK